MLYLGISSHSPFSLNDIIFQNVPADYEDNIFRSQVQPNIMSKVVEINGLRLSVKLNQIVGRKIDDHFQIHQVQGQIFIKLL